jgi:hypothetical protein
VGGEEEVAVGNQTGGKEVEKTQVMTKEVEEDMLVERMGALVLRDK